jgi:hypothetical protein
MSKAPCIGMIHAQRAHGDPKHCSGETPEKGRSGMQCFRSPESRRSPDRNLEVGVHKKCGCEAFSADSIKAGLGCYFRNKLIKILTIWAKGDTNICNGLIVNSPTRVMNRISRL